MALDTITNQTTVNPIFTADLTGQYSIKLTVTDSKSVISEDTITVSVTAASANAAPVANAGTGQSVVAGAVVTLDGSASSDANSDPLTYSWTFTSKPAGSSATLSSTTVANPTFTADAAGAYVINLVVNDGKIGSASATVTVTASVANAAPVANAGTGQSVVAGAVVTLDGSTSSDANSDPLTYSWAFTSKPAGSTATLSSATAAKPTFTADVAGAYVLNLVVNDGKINSASTTVTVTATAANAAPVANAGTGQSVVTGEIVTLDGSASSDANSDPLTYIWAFTSKPAGSNATLSSTTAAKPTFTPDVTGSYVLNLVVNDGKENSSTVSVVITVLEKVTAYLTIKDSFYYGMSLCSFSGTINSAGYNWTFTNCRIYGNAGNVVTAKITNNSNATQIIQSLSLRYSTGPYFEQNYTVNETISPKTTLLYDLTLNTGADITDSTVTFKLNSLPDVIGNFTINN